MTGPQENRVTGGFVTEMQRQRLLSLDATASALLDVMHVAEGSMPPGEHQEHVFQTRRMNIAATHIETALMFARKAALEHP